MPKTYILFEEIESELAERAPKIVYKYRNWKEDNHKNVLRQGHAWFSHPFDLNDPLDVRPEIEFDMSELDDPRYLQRLIESESDMHTDRDRRIRAENKLQELKDFPDLLKTNSAKWNAKRENFDRYGVFSTAMNPLIFDVWNDYGDSHSGYCIGVNTIELCRQVKSGFGFVTYSDAPFLHKFLDKKDDGLDMLYLKKTKWGVEDEFRFITVGVDVYTERLQEFKLDTVAEIYLGYNIGKDAEDDIISIVKNQYPRGFPVYKTKLLGKNKLDKIKIL